MLKTINFWIFKQYLNSSRLYQYEMVWNFKLGLMFAISRCDS